MDLPPHSIEPTPEGEPSAAPVPADPWDAVARKHEMLAERFGSLASGRNGKPVYAVEHAMDPAEVEQLARMVGALLRRAPLEALEPNTLPLIVVASETGYAYTGMWTGYWPLLGAASGLDLGSISRKRLTNWFERASVRHGLKRPNDTPFARTFRHIAWPIANALAPRQLHAGIATMLRDVAVLAEFVDDETFVRRLHAAAMRSGSDRLIEWSADETRLSLLADALLRPERERSDLSPRMVARLVRDLGTVPGAMERVVEARRIIARRAGGIRPARLVLAEDGDGAFRLGLRREYGLTEDRQSVPTIAVEALADIATTAKEHGLSIREARTEALVFVEAGESFISWVKADGPVDPASEILVLSSDVLDRHDGLSLVGSCAGGEVYRIAAEGASRAEVLDLMKVPRGGESVTVTGGLRLDFGRRFVAGIPVRVSRGEPVETTTASWAIARPRIPLAPGQSILLDGTPGLEVDVVADDTGSDVARFSFVESPIATAAVRVRVDPPEPTPRDLLEGRLTIDLAGSRDFTVPVRLTLTVPGEPAVTARLDAPLPRRLSTAAGLDVLRDAVASLARRPTTLSLTVDYAVDRTEIVLAEPPGTVRFVEEDGTWRAIDMTDGEEVDVRFSVVDAASPFSPAGKPLIAEPAFGDGYRLLVPDLDAAPGLLIGPAVLRGGVPAVTCPAPHRRLNGRADDPGLVDEIGAMLHFSNAEAQHNIAGGVARSVAAAAERAVVTTLCGDRWARREGGGLMSPAAALIESALADERDLLAAGDLGEADRAEVEEFKRHLEPRLSRMPEVEAAVAGGGVTESLAERLDIAAEEAWEDVDEAREAHGLEPLHRAPGGVPEDWEAVCAAAAAVVVRRDLAAMIAPRALGEALLAIPYGTSPSADVAREIDRHRKDLGALRSAARRLSADAIDDALALFLRPAAFARTEWAPLAARLLEDRMTSRAVRYAALRLRATSAG